MNIWLQKRWFSGWQYKVLGNSENSLAIQRTVRLTVWFTKMPWRENRASQMNAKNVIVNTIKRSGLRVPQRQSGLGQRLQKTQRFIFYSFTNDSFHRVNFVHNLCKHNAFATEPDISSPFFFCYSLLVCDSHLYIVCPMPVECSQSVNWNYCRSKQIPGYCCLLFAVFISNFPYSMQKIHTNIFNIMNFDCVAWATLFRECGDCNRTCSGGFTFNRYVFFYFPSVWIPRRIRMKWYTSRFSSPYFIHTDKIFHSLSPW